MTEGGERHLDTERGMTTNIVCIYKCILNCKRNAQTYTGYLKFIYVGKMHSFSHRKSKNMYKIKSDIHTADTFDSTIDFPSLLM